MNAKVIIVALCAIQVRHYCVYFTENLHRFLINWEVAVACILYRIYCYDETEARKANGIVSCCSAGNPPSPRNSVPR